MDVNLTSQPPARADRMESFLLAKLQLDFAETVNC